MFFLFLTCKVLKRQSACKAPNMGKENVYRAPFKEKNNITKNMYFENFELIRYQTPEIPCKSALYGVTKQNYQK